MKTTYFSSSSVYCKRNQKMHQVHHFLFTVGFLQGPDTACISRRSHDLSIGSVIVLISRKWLLWIVNICSGILQLHMSGDHDTFTPCTAAYVPALSVTTHCSLGVNAAPPATFPPSVFSKLNLHNWGWSCFPFTLHNSWGPWQLLYHWLVITHGTPLWSHPWDLCDRKTKAVKGQGYKEPVWPPWMHLWGHKEALKGKLSVVELAVLLKHNALEALEDSDVWCWHQDWPASCSATLIMFSEI